MSEHETYLTEAQVAEFVPGMSRRTLRALRHLGGGPVFSKPTPKKVIYLRSDVEQWLRQNRHTRTDRRVAS